MISPAQTQTSAATAGQPRRLRQILERACRVGAIVPAVLVLTSVVRAPASNWTVRAALAAFCVLAVLRPDAALLVTSAFVGFGIILSHTMGVPTLRVTEVLVVASLAGYWIRALGRDSPVRRELAGGVTIPVALFALAAIASTVVWLRVQQFEAGYAWPYVQALLRSLVTGYFVQPGEFLLLVSMAVVLEGLALYVVVAALCRVDATFFEKAVRMLAVGGAGLAVMSIVRLAEIILRNPGAIDALRKTSVGLRISPQIPDYIAAGSYFALCWLVSLGIALAVPRRRIAWLAAGLPLLAALYLTGSRSVIAAALAGLVVFVVVLVRQNAMAVRGIVAAAALSVVVMIVSYPWLTGRDIAGEMARQSLIVRSELARTAVQVIATRPAFGVGIDRFYLIAEGLASPQLNALWPGRKNPHNDFLRIGAELGLVGLLLFLWILAIAGRRIWQALHETRDPRLAGLVGGLAAFMVTSFVSNPLMVRDVSYVFWIALGLAAGQAARPSTTLSRETSAGSHRWTPSRLRLPLALLAGALLCVSIPFRAGQEIAARDVTRVTFGLFEWNTDPEGRRFRWSGGHATVFVKEGGRIVEIPLCGTLPSGAPQQVEIRVDGKLANRIVVGPEWQRLRTLLPGDRPSGTRRIDFIVTPSWVPADTIPGNPDRRALGVKIGEITVR